jgi:hypothetical protein
MKNVLNITSVLLVVVLILVVVCCMKKNKENYKHFENLAPWPISWRPYPTRYTVAGWGGNGPPDLESKKISNRCHELTKLGCGLTASCPSKDMPGGSGWEAGSYPCAEERVSPVGKLALISSNCNSNKGDRWGVEGKKITTTKKREKYNYGWNNHTNHCGKDPSRNRGKKCAEWTKQCKTQLYKEQDEYFAAERKKQIDKKMYWIGTRWNDPEMEEGKEKPNKNWECTTRTKARDMNKSDTMGDKEFAEGKFSINLKNMTRKGCADACNNKKYYFQAPSKGGPDYPTECKSLDYNTSKSDGHGEYTCRLFSGRRQKDDASGAPGGIAEGKAYDWDYCVKKYDVTDKAFCTPGSISYKDTNIGTYQSMTVDEATKKCNDDDNCKGFTMKKGNGSMPNQIILKSKIDGNTPNSRYTCYVK